MTKKISLLIVFCMLFGMMLVACQPAVPTESDTDGNSESITETLPETDEVTESEETEPEATEPEETEPEEVKKKSIDVYIIAGQSNAAGMTIYNGATLFGLWEDYMTGTPNVLYSGRAEGNYVGKWTNAKAGQGINSSRIGPEVGMAATLSEYYTGDKVAGIIKFSYGGTSLFNNTTGYNEVAGNWCPPSYAEARGYKNTGLTGGLYRGLLKQFYESYKALKDEGYEEINIKAIFWMQGESDRGNPTEYVTAFKYFASDIRTDLGKLAKQDLSKLPIIVGEISRTTGSADANNVTTNATFIKMQNDLVNQVNDVYVVNTSQYDVNTLVNGVNTPVQDGWHWGTEGIFNVGALAGRCIIDEILAK